jgi:hypothetical protein
MTASGTGNPVTFTPDDSPPTVTLVPIGATPPGVQVNVSATIKDDQSPITDVTIYYRSIAAGGTPLSKKMTKGDGDAYSAAIEAAAVGDLGVEYKISATSSGGTSADTKYTAVVVSSGGSGTTVPYDAFGSEQKNYRIIAVPLELAAKTVAAVFEELGAADKKKWRLSHYQNGSTTELTTSDNILAGQGYWLIIKESGISLSTGAGNTVAATSDEPFSINLTSGWNQIGNPYPFNLLWQDVVDANPGLTTLRTFREDNPGGGDYPWGDGTVLRAKEGGFFNNTNNLTKLKFPVIKKASASRVLPNPLVTNPLTDRNWQLYIVAKHDDLVNSISGIGMRENASANGDAFDGYSMPRFFDRYLEINHRKTSGKDFMSMDIVPPADDHVWEFDVETSETSRLITLEWDNTNFGDNDLGLILWDESRQYGIDMRAENSYTFDRGISKAFKIYFGQSDKLIEKLDIKGLFLHSVSPNPAEAEVKVAFSVPGSQTVEFEVVDLLGRAVWQVSGTFNKGYHEVTWAGETRDRAHGLYIIRLRSGDEAVTSRIYLK